MENYHNLGMKLMEQGAMNHTRTGITRSLTGEKLDFDLRDGFPLVTSKKVNFNHILHETIWYLKGTSSIEYLQSQGIKIWDNWADENNDIGPTYGVQWRNFGGVDQIKQVIEDIENGGNRRMIVNGWNPPQLNAMALPPCLVMMQYHLDGDLLHCTVYQRSADWCIGVPYDIAEMALLQSLIAKVTGKIPAKLTIFYGDAHIYENHIEPFKKQLEYKNASLPSLILEDDIQDIDEIYPDSIGLANYKPGPFIRYPIAI